MFSTTICKSAEGKNVEHIKYRKFQDVIVKRINTLNKGYNNKKVFAACANRTAEGKVMS